MFSGQSLFHCIELAGVGKCRDKIETEWSQGVRMDGTEYDTRNEERQAGIEA
jgi:hypothetical protein